MEIFVKERGPLALVNFHLPWSEKFEEFDLFVDPFSNQLIFHNDGYFMIREEYQRHRKSTSIPFILNLATSYKRIHACAIHPSRGCLALQTNLTSVTLLFLKQRQAEELVL